MTSSQKAPAVMRRQKALDAAVDLGAAGKLSPEYEWCAESLSGSRREERHRCRQR
jgi:hypothetical protein